MYRTTLDLPDEIGRRYEELALQTGQQPEEVMRDVLAEHLAQREEDVRLSEARAAVARGEYVTAEEIHVEDEALLDHLGITPEQRAAIRAEVEAEAAAVYGV